MGTTRRSFLTGVPAVLLASTRSRAQVAQTTRRPRVVMILTGTEALSRPFRERFEAGMREAGHVHGESFEFDVRIGSDARATGGLIEAAVVERPDVLVVAGLTAARRARDATWTIPVVVATASDLVDAGVVKSYARPGGNITGISDLVDEAAVKRLELARLALPRARRVVLLTNPDFPATPKIETRVQSAAPALGFTIRVIRASDRATLSAALEALQPVDADALLPGGDPMFNADEFMAKAVSTRIPLIHYWQGTAQRGALVSYEADVLDNFMRAAGYVDRILKGAHPGDLPVYQPTRYTLVVNAGVAKTLGIELPEALMQRADKVVP
jgi:putative ABC transport system substrate-binding protein